jgi:glycosyltransferase involved in cell wall biosynthesis
MLQPSSGGSIFFPEMRILLVSQYFWPETFLINDLMCMMQARGVEVTVLTGKPNYPDGRVFKGYRTLGVQRETYDGISIIRVPVISRGKSRIRLAMNYLSFILSGGLYGPPALRGTEYDLIFVYAPSPILQALPAILLARMRQVPLILWVQDLWPESLSATGHVKSRWLISLVATMVRFIYRKSDRILVQSRAFVGPVTSLTDQPSKILYYPNLFQTSAAIEPSQRARDLARDLQQCFSVVFAGNLGAAQSLETIVEAACLLKGDTNIRIYLVGSGSQDAWLAQEVDARGIENLVLSGRFCAADMPLLFSAASALLVTLRPDSIFQHTVPSKVQAYLAAGRPVLASLNGEGARIVREAGAGLTSPAGDAAKLANAISNMSEMPKSERDSMGRRGRTYFDQHFSPEQLADDLLEHCRRVLS